MARNLDRLMDAVASQRDVFVTEDGRVEEAGEAEQNAVAEASSGREPRRRTRLKPARFGARPLTVHLRALRAMHADAARSAVETGGLCIGRDDDTIDGYIASGPNADRRPSSYALDVKYLQCRLEAAENDGQCLVGVHHVHPRGCDALSAQDRITARAILSDPDWAIERLYLPLTVRTRLGFSTFFFVADDGGRTITQVPVVLVDDRETVDENDAYPTDRVPTFDELQSKGAPPPDVGPKDPCGVVTDKPVVVTPRTSLVGHPRFSVSAHVMSLGTSALGRLFARHMNRALRLP